MIELNIHSPTDQDISGPYLSFADMLILGRGSSADLIISDPEIDSHELRFEIVEQSLRAIPFEGRIFWHNGKKTVSARNIKMGDTLRLGKTEIKIMNFILTPQNKNAHENLEERFVKVISADPIKRDLLDSLKQELQTLSEGRFHVSKDPR